MLKCILFFFFTLLLKTVKSASCLLVTVKLGNNFFLSEGNAKICCLQIGLHNKFYPQFSFVTVSQQRKLHIVILKIQQKYTHSNFHYIIQTY